MLIDWFTVIAQVINFLVLVWLLRRFLYRPILNAIDAREKRIAAALADADATRAAAEQQRDDYRDKNTEFDNQKKARMAQVAGEAKAERVRLLDAVRQEADELRDKLQTALANEQVSLKETFNRRAQDEVFAIARKALNDLAETTLEARMAEIFVERVRALSDDDLVKLRTAFSASAEPLTVRTAFALPEQQRTYIDRTLNDILGTKVAVQFITEPDVISGIEITANGQNIGWSIAGYLASLSTRVDQILQVPENRQSADTYDRRETKESDSHEASV